MIGVPAGEIVNYEKQFQEIYNEQAQKLADVLDMDGSLLLDDYTKLVSPGYGQHIRSIRSKLGLSQKKFLEMLGVNRSTVSMWESVSSIMMALPRKPPCRLYLPTRSRNT